MKLRELLLACTMTQSVSMVAGADAEVITGSADALHDYLKDTVLNGAVVEVEARDNVVMAWIDLDPEEE